MPNPQTLSVWLADAKRVHSALPADFPAHRWEDFYADYLVARWDRDRKAAAIARQEAPVLHAPSPLTSYDL